MQPGFAEVGLLLLSFIIPLLLVILTMPRFITYLARSGRVADDVHKHPPTKVPFPVGPLLFLGALAGEIFAYLAFGSLVPLAVIGGGAVAFAIGLADDLFVLGGRTKPLLLLFAAVPLVVSAMFQKELYESNLTFPLLGHIGEHFTIYVLLVIVAFPVVANAFNMMDSFNGQISGFTLLTSLALLFGVVLHAITDPGFSLARVASVLPLVATSAGFLVFNRYPSKAFDGDSGSLTFGTMFASLAITGGVEIAAMIAIVPAILNSFYTLSSARGFMERRRMTARPTRLGEDGRMYASFEPSSPNTLIRLILLSGPREERDLVKSILVLTAVACLLSGAISILTWVY
jgi:UDP-N-acetylmuramyl pentapeptide phosphotransferase/UDP-N-acetylglucosamine-1-phosphate transferase